MFYLFFVILFRAMNPFDVHIFMEQCFNHQDFLTTKLSWFMSLSFPKKKSGISPVGSI